jgi:6-phosphogluconolactonase
VAGHELEILGDAEAVAKRGAELIARWAGAAVVDHGRFTLAVSGGRTPWVMFRELASEDVPWEQVELYQVDERVAPAGDPDRNLTRLEETLPPAAKASLRPMPVDAPDLNRAAEDYAASLPARFDLIHLGLGDDGHTASLVPGDPVLDVTDRDVALTGVYNGRRRMTLTYPVLNRAAQVLWLVTGAEKAGPLARLRAHDAAIPAGRVHAARSLILADQAAASGEA